MKQEKKERKKRLNIEQIEKEVDEIQLDFPELSEIEEREIINVPFSVTGVFYIYDIMDYFNIKTFEEFVSFIKNYKQNDDPKVKEFSKILTVMNIEFV